MSVAINIIFVTAILTSLVIVPLGLPGTWAMVGLALIYSLVGDFDQAGRDHWVVVIVAALAILAEALEFLIGIWGSRKLAVSTGAIVASIVGAIIGAVIGVPVFLVGPLLGLLIGVFVGALAFELFVRKDFREALRAAFAATASRVTAMFLKTSVALVMVIYLLLKTF